jgi:hypothetical protein
LFGLLVPGDDTNDSEAKNHLRTALESAAGRLLHEHPSALLEAGEDSHRSLLHRARSLAERVCRQLHGDAGQFLRFWRCVEQTLSPVAATGPEEVISESEAIATTCLDHWPTGQANAPSRADPRHPVRLFLELCEKARCLARAEHLLDGLPATAQEARGHLDRVLGLGLDSVDHLRRAATVLYLIECRQEDSSRVQRRVLERLDAWAERATTDTEKCVEEANILEALAAIRRDVVSDQSASGESHRLAES